VSAERWNLAEGKPTRDGDCQAALHKITTFMNEKSSQASHSDIFLLNLSEETMILEIPYPFG